jgi:class 3 adenylate cyclase
VSAAAPSRPVGSAVLLEPERKHVAALIADVSGFTEFVETIEPEILFQVIRDFHTVMGRAITREGGTVVNYGGDAMLVVFNGPIAVSDPERRAVRTALGMRDGFLGHVVDWSKQGFRLGLRIGIEAGFVSLGTIGFPGRQELGVMGRAVNIAARLCAEATIGSIFTSERLANGLDGAFELRPMGRLTPKGFSRPIAVVEILSERDGGLEQDNDTGRL